MNVLFIETKNGIKYWAHATDSDLDEFKDDITYYERDYAEVKCAKTKRTLVFKRSDISSYSYGKVGEEESQ
ncbi:hypothetical protein [Bacillus pumilus]|uniref:hypothetical protein n=1 Tax=Bacillus pumilus TaxID=1408 RepID=UPI0015D5618E|nr:hypothetical protein [Bacillus pumilus]QLI77134.1 hypothetical protein HZ310_04625 [Bacillus pumilus]